MPLRYREISGTLTPPIDEFSAGSWHLDEGKWLVLKKHCPVVECASFVFVFSCSRSLPPSRPLFLLLFRALFHSRPCLFSSLAPSASSFARSTFVFTQRCLSFNLLSLSLCLICAFSLSISFTISLSLSLSLSRSLSIVWRHRNQTECVWQAGGCRR